MGIFAKLFGKKNEEEARVGGMEDFMTLIRVYYHQQSGRIAGLACLQADLACSYGEQQTGYRGTETLPEHAHGRVWHSGRVL